MFKKILIANRGEIALRIMRTCQEMGIKTVAVHSTVDAESIHVKLADESVCIGPAIPSESYLNHKAILTAAIVTGSEGIHPGYGFLAENAEFARKCNEHNITFIGPTPEAMIRMGDKIMARDTITKVGVPTVPGSPGALKSAKEALTISKKIGYPVILKASAGGGGKGMKIVRSDSELETAYYTAKAESMAAFGNDEMFVEKFLENPKHVEVQIIADKHGNITHLGERDCSIQRRYQKLIEESPCSILDDKTRNKMYKAAIAAAKSVNYDSVGTVEFIYENGKFYFMEMNTRVQVEHPVTEMVCGVDIIQEQIRIAAGLEMSVPSKNLKSRGHSIECRVNAEDPIKFYPSPGTISDYYAPGGLGVRVDSACYSGYTVLPNYDSMVAKLIVHGKTRDDAISKMKRALDEYIIHGIKTNIPFHQALLKEKPFLDGTYTTNYLTNNKIHIPTEDTPA
jgi:acetyl-CoA carboxylase biotin carboxylase subunit